MARPYFGTKSLSFLVFTLLEVKRKEKNLRIETFGLSLLVAEYSCYYAKHTSKFADINFY